MYTQTAKVKPVLQIIPDTHFLVFHGDEHTAETTKLRGVVRLDSSESLTIKRIKVRLEGKRKVGWFMPSGTSGSELADRKTFHNDERSLGTGSTHKTRPGEMNWPFEFNLTPDLPESVEGTDDTFVVYNLHAQVERPNWKARDLHATTHIRIVRTMTRDQLEAARSRVNADIWANKISYSISIPSDAVVFGTSILADVDLSPLRKGIRLGRVSLKLTENTIKRISPPLMSDHLQERVKQDETEVCRHDMDFPEHSRVTFDDETVDNPTMQDERYHFKARLPLPKSLKQCRQDVDSHPIAITHKLRLMVNIHNPEGHISQLVCKLPVRLFISPHLPIGESDEVQAGLTSMVEEQLNNQEMLVAAPPNYGEHQLDELYSDIAPNGYRSSFPSGAHTPIGILSRRSSHENLNGEYVRSGTHELSGAEIDSVLLSSRLASLDETLVSTPRAGVQSSGSSPIDSQSPDPSPRDTIYMTPRAHRATNGSAANSIRTASAQNSRRSSIDRTVTLRPHDLGISADHHSPLDREATITQQSHLHLQSLPPGYDPEALARIPSYGTALRSNRRVTPVSEYPPSYTEATSRPPSPQLHRNSSGDDSNSGRIMSRVGGVSSESIPEETMSGAASSNVTTVGDPERAALSRPNSRSAAAVDDAEARLRMLRSRS